MSVARTIYCMESTVPAAALHEIRDVYKRLTAELTPLLRHCEARGVCCNFDSAGHMLYVTTIEAAEMSASGVEPDMSLSASGRCPFLRGKMCGIRDHRALGCRTYFCDSTYSEERNALYEKFLRESRQIEARHGLEHSYLPVTKVDFTAKAQRHTE